MTPDIEAAVGLAHFIVDTDKEIGDAMGLPIGDDLHLARSLLSLHAEVEAMRVVASRLVDAIGHCKVCRDCGDGPCCDACDVDDAIDTYRARKEGK